jgi:hypothetical protein
MSLGKVDVIYAGFYPAAFMNNRKSGENPPDGNGLSRFNGIGCGLRMPVAYPSAAFASDSFELVRIGGKATAGITKDVVMLGGFQEAEFDFVADNPGLTLHCHQQLHMDFGFMALFKYA